MSSRGNTEKIVQLAEQKSLRTREQVKQALAALHQRGEAINFASVCCEAKVSKTFLYDPKHADLAEEIRRKRDQPVSLATPSTSSSSLNASVRQEPVRGKTESAKDVQIARLKERLRVVEGQAERLKQENELLYGKLADWQAGTLSRATVVGANITESLPISASSSASTSAPLNDLAPAVVAQTSLKPPGRKVQRGRKASSESERNYWVIEAEAETEHYGPMSKPQAERLQTRLGKARIYQAAALSEAYEQHRRFLIGVVKGSQMW